MKFFSFLVFMLCSFSLQADKYDYLYTEKMPRENSIREPQKEALWNVIYRLTPEELDRENPIINDAIAKDYILNTKKTDKEIIYRFSPEKINTLIKKSGQQLWIKARPKLYAVITLVDRKTWQSFIITRKEHPEIFTKIAEACKKKGLDVTFDSPKITEIIKKYNPEYPLFNRDIDGLREVSKEIDDGAMIFFITLNYVDGEQKHQELGRVLHKGKLLGYNSENRYNNTVPPNDKVGEISVKYATQVLFDDLEKPRTPIHSAYVRFNKLGTLKEFYSIEPYLNDIKGVIRVDPNSVTEDTVLYKIYMEFPEDLLALRLSRKYIAEPDVKNEGIQNYRIH